MEDEDVDIVIVITRPNKTDWNRLLDIGQAGLDVLGWVPGVGEAADLVNAGISAARGNYLEAGLSLVSLIPGAGDAIGKGAKFALNAQDPKVAKLTLEAMREVDFTELFKKLSSHPQVARHVGALQQGLDKVADELARLAGVQKPNFAMAGGGDLPSAPGRTPGRSGGTGKKKGAPSGTTHPDSIPTLSATTPRNIRGTAVREVRDGWTRAARYARASDLDVLVPESKAWNAAIRELRKGGPEAINNIRVRNASDAKKLLLQAFPPGTSNALSHARTHLNDAPGTYQFHPPDLADVNDLSHIKWTSPNGGGHIWFGNPGNSGASVHYVSQRDFDRLMSNEGFTREELEAFGVRPGGNRIGPDRRDAINSHHLSPGNRPGR
jgi:hypothetical protein